MLEFIICDDGSTDDTCRLLDEIVKQDNRIIIIKMKETVKRDMHEIARYVQQKENM